MILVINCPHCLSRLEVETTDEQTTVTHKHPEAFDVMDFKGEAMVPYPTAYIGTVPPLHKGPHVWAVMEDGTADIACVKCEKVWEDNEK